MDIKKNKKKPLKNDVDKGYSSDNIKNIYRNDQVFNQPAFVLHSFPYKETSLILEIFSLNFGKISLIAKGAKRPLSKFRGILQSFQMLSLSWIGKYEIKNLVSADWVGGIVPLEKSNLLFGFYLNELLIKLLEKNFPYPNLFENYVKTLNNLSTKVSLSVVLRKFELYLLKETGVVGSLGVISKSGHCINPDKKYVFEPNSGIREAIMNDSIPVIFGKTLLDMENEKYSDINTQNQSKILMRYLLNYHLAGAKLNSRQILIDLLHL